MQFAGEARRAALRLILITLAVVGGTALAGLLLLMAGFVATFLGGLLLYAALGLLATWLLFAIFTFYFFRDPDAKTPDGPGLVICPGHGRIDAIETLPESQFPGGPCRRVSMFLSLFNVHVQNAPVSAKVISVTHTAGSFLNATKADSARYNENVLIGFESTETAGEKIGLRLIAGVLARRIVPFVKPGDEVRRGGRISLIQFGSRCDLYLPVAYNIRVKIGDKVAGGETIIASKS